MSPDDDLAALEIAVAPGDESGLADSQSAKREKLHQFGGGLGVAAAGTSHLGNELFKLSILRQLDPLPRALSDALGGSGGIVIAGTGFHRNGEDASENADGVVVGG